MNIHPLLIFTICPHDIKNDTENTHILIILLQKRYILSQYSTAQTKRLQFKYFHQKRELSFSLISFSKVFCHLLSRNGVYIWPGTTIHRFCDLWASVSGCYISTHSNGFIERIVESSASVRIELIHIGKQHLSKSRCRRTSSRKSISVAC